MDSDDRNDADEADEPASPWAALRRVHFYVSDLFFRQAARIDIDFANRRVLDYLDFARDRGALDGLTVRDLCELIPPRMRTQQVVATIDRLRDRGFVEPGDERTTGLRRGRLWRLTEAGQAARTAYKTLMEEILQDVYRDGTDDNIDALREHWIRAGDYVDRSRERILQAVVPTVRRPSVRPGPWSTLRQAHFQTNDQFFAAMQAVGVTPENRRVLDALDLARTRGVEAPTVATVAKLIELTPPPAAVTAELLRMQARNWVEPAGTATSKPATPWRLTAGGRELRRDYTQVAEGLLRGAYAGEPPVGLRELARTADRHRARRLEPIVSLTLGPATPAP